MKKKAEHITDDQWDFVTSIIEFFDHKYFEDTMIDTLNGTEDKIEHIGKEVQFVMTICQGFFNNRNILLESELMDILGPPVIDFALQDRLAERLIATGFYTYIVGDDIFAFKPYITLDREYNPIEKWALIKIIANNDFKFGFVTCRNGELA